MDILYCPSCGAPNPVELNTCTSCQQDFTLVRAVISAANEHYNHALALAQKGLFDEAIVEVQSAIGLNSHHPKYSNLLASCYANKGLYSMAVREWEKVLRLDDQFDQAYKGIGRVKKYEILTQKQYLERPQRVWGMVVGILCMILFVSTMLFWDKYKSSKQEMVSDKIYVADLLREITDLKSQQKGSNFSPQVAEALTKSIEEKQAIIDTLNSEVSMLKQDLDTKTSNLASLEKELESVRSNSQSAQADLEKTNLEYQEELKRLTQSNEELKANLAKAGSTQNEESKTLIESYKKEISSLKKEIEKQNSSLAALTKSELETKNQLAEIQSEKAKLESGIAFLNKQISASLEARTILEKSLGLLVAGNYAEATIGFESFQKIFPQSSVAVPAIAYAKQKQEESEDPLLKLYWEEVESEKDSKLKEIQEKAVKEYLNQSKQLLKQKQFDQALEALGKAKQLDPENESIISEIQDVESQKSKNQKEAYDFAPDW